MLGTSLMPGTGSPFVISSTIWLNEGGYGADGWSSCWAGPASELFSVVMPLTDPFDVTGSSVMGVAEAVTRGRFWVDRHEM